jgi:hypothetical protein
VEILNSSIDALGHLAEYFVIHGRIGLAANVVAELRFYHADRERASPRKVTFCFDAVWIA